MATLIIHELRVSLETQSNFISFVFSHNDAILIYSSDSRNSKIPLSNEVCDHFQQSFVAFNKMKLKLIEHLNPEAINRVACLLTSFYYSAFSLFMCQSVNSVKNGIEEAKELKKTKVEMSDFAFYSLFFTYRNNFSFRH